MRLAYRNDVIRIFGAGYERKGKRKYSDGLIEEIKIINDFLPSPEELAFKEDTVKVILSLSKSSVEFFKGKALENNTAYQKMIRKIILLIVIAIFGAQIIAHQDSIIQVSETGAMEGFPEAYLPAKIDLEKNVISIAKVTLTMPPCLSKYFADPESYEMHVTSSWYHQRSTLPPYVNFKISPQGKDFEYSLLFGVENLKVIELQVITHPNDKDTAFHKIDIGDRCTKAIGSSYEAK